MATEDPRGKGTMVEEPPSRGQKIALGVFGATLSVIFGLLVARLLWIQVVQHETHLARARLGIGRTDRVEAYPGDIRSADGTILARSLLAHDIGLDLDTLAEAEVVDAIVVLSQALGLPAETRRERLDDALRRKRADRSYVHIAKRIDRDLKDRALEALAGVVGADRVRRVAVLDPVTRRVYPRGDFLAHVIGVNDASGSGLEGVERSREDYLRPSPGKRGVLTDAREEFRFFFPENFEVAPVNGYDIVLTIDVRAQRIVEEELAAGVERHQAEAGLAILMDCRTGDVLAMASVPEFDPNEYHHYPRGELDRRRKNRVIENVYEPGSVIKPFIAAAALEAGLFRPGEIIWEGGRYHSIGGRRVTDVSDHGPIDIEGAVIYSSNIGLSLIGMRLGPAGVQKVIRDFRFCQSTGIGLPFEEAGSHTKPEDWNEVYSTVSVSFGYEILISPIQLATAFSALINGGQMMQPRVIDRLVANGKEVKNPVRVVGRPIQEETSRVMRETLRRVVDEGTAQYLKMEGFEFGGKTGTADMDPRYTKRDYLASFEAFAPFEDPEVVCLVMIEKPRSGKIYGGSVAGPVVARIFRRWFRVEAEPRFLKNKWPGW